MVPRHEITKRKGKNEMKQIKKPSFIEYILLPGGIALAYGVFGIVNDDPIMKWVFTILQMVQLVIFWVSGYQYMKEMREFGKAQWLNLIEELSILIENEPAEVKNYFERMVRQDFPDIEDEIEEIFNKNQGEKDNAISVPLDHSQE